MLIETGRVVAVEADALWVETIRQSTCGTCAARQGCGHGLLNRIGDGRTGYVRVLRGPASDRRPCAVNDQVRISIPEQVILRGSAVVYMLPLLCMLAGAALAVQVFGGEDAIGPLYAAPAAGAFAGALFSGWLGRIDAQGRAVLWSVLAWGGAIAGFGVVAALPSAEVLLPLALAFLAVAGAADVVSAVFRNSILQLTVPDRLRGRLSAVHIAVVTGGPRLGDVEAGVVAALTSPVASVITGGLACMAGVGVVAKLMPAMGAWRLSRHGVVDADVATAD